MENIKIGFNLFVWALICVSVLQVVKSQNRITNGFVARPNQFPWQVALMNESMSFYCGGSLIHPQWVLTAARCVNKRKPLYVMYGTNQLDDDSVPIMNSEKIFIPKDSVVLLSPIFAARHDIGLIKLPQLINTDDSVKVIPLVSASEMHNDFAEETALIEGFGSTNGQEGNYSQNLMYGYVQMKNNKLCIGRTSSNIFYPDNKDTVLCAVSSSNQESICLGDSGGPLIFDGNGGFVQIGVISFSDNCEGGTNQMGFTKVAWYLNWISEVTGIIFE